jgi:hypothetical protein
MELLQGETPEPVLKEFISGKKNTRLIYKALEPAQYKIKLLEDQNRNEKWDSGDYFKHRQPEPIYIRNLDPLRPNWDMDLTIDWEDRKKLPKN